MIEWDTYKIRDISEVQTGPFGSQLHNNDYVAIGTPIVTVEHLGNRKFTSQNLPRVSAEDKARLAKYVSKKGDIIFSRVGSVDRCSYVSDAEEGWLFSGRCLRVRPQKGVDPLFLYYWFSQESIKQEIRNVAVGATMPSINTKLLSDIIIKLPSLEKQKQISAILSSIDDKIELNNRINHNLEEQAQALYKSWFIDFEPFKDGKFGESELGMIPEGWRVKPAVEVCPITIGKTPPRQEHQWFSVSNNDHKWVSISDMGTCGVFINESSERLTDAAINKFNIGLVPENTVLLSFKLTVGRVAIANCELTTNEAIARFITPAELTNYIYLVLKNYDYSKLGSTSSIATAVNSKIIKNMSILMPEEYCLRAFDLAVAPYFKEIQNRQDENNRLTIFRDSLLPKLMSGELNINEIDC